MEVFVNQKRVCARADDGSTSDVSRAADSDMNNIQNIHPFHF